MPTNAGLPTERLVVSIHLVIEPNFIYVNQLSLINTIVGQFLSYTIFLSLSSHKPERGDIRIILANGQVREVNFQ